MERPDRIDYETRDGGHFYFDIDRYISDHDKYIEHLQSRIKEAERIMKDSLKIMYKNSERCSLEFIPDHNIQDIQHYFDNE